MSEIRAHYPTSTISMSCSGEEAPPLQVQGEEEEGGEGKGGEKTKGKREKRKGGRGT